MKKLLRAVSIAGPILLAAGLLAPAARAGDEVRPERLRPSPAAGAPALAAGVIVKYKAGAEPSAIQAAASDAVGEDTTVSVVAKRTRAYASDVTPLAEAQAAADELAQRDDVEWAEPNGIRYATADSPWPVATNDPNSLLLRNVWDMRGPENSWVSGIGVTPWPVGGYSTKAPALWSATTGAGVVVAVLDTGIIANHPDLAPNLVAGYDMVSNTVSSNDGDGRDANPSDPGDWTTSNLCYSGQTARNSSWHGSHVAGTIAAVANNGQGVVGVAPGAKIQPIRVLGRCGGSDADIATGILWAAGVPVPGLPGNPTPAKVINMSLGGQGACSQNYVDAINAARGAGATIMVALGNDNADASAYTPASCAGIVGVHSTSDYGDHASYSNYGSQADISAPGGDSAWGENLGIYSTIDNGTTSPTGPGYGWKDGTSMATPAAAGVAALLASIGQFSPDALEAALKAAVIAFPSGRSDVGFLPCNTTQCGTGIVDATKIPAPVSAPGIAGTPLPGQTLTAAGGAWMGPATGRVLTWYANGLPVGSGPAYVVSIGDVGKQIVVRESVDSGPFAPIGAYSGAVVVANPTPPGNAKKKAKLKVKAPHTVSVFTKAKLKVTVKIKGKKKPTGKLTVKDGKAKIAKGKLKAKKKGKITITLPRLSIGVHKIKVSFKGSGASGSKTVTIRVAKRR